jgi:hypothetical protein
VCGHVEYQSALEAESVMYFCLILLIFTPAESNVSEKVTRCKQLLDRRSIDSGWGPRTCRLIRYGPEKLTQCVDNMTVARRGKLHFVFIGDSRIRQQFYSFLEVSTNMFSLFMHVASDFVVKNR